MSEVMNETTSSVNDINDSTDESIVQTHNINSSSNKIAEQIADLNIECPENNILNKIDSNSDNLILNCVGDTLKDSPSKEIVVLFEKKDPTKKRLELIENEIQSSITIQDPETNRNVCNRTIDAENKSLQSEISNYTLEPDNVSSKQTSMNRPRSMFTYSGNQISSNILQQDQSIIAAIPNMNVFQQQNIPGAQKYIFDQNLQNNHLAQNLAVLNGSGNGIHEPPNYQCAIGNECIYRIDTAERTDLDPFDGIVYDYKNAISANQNIIDDERNGYITKYQNMSGEFECPVDIGQKYISPRDYNNQDSYIHYRLNGNLSDYEQTIKNYRNKKESEYSINKKGSKDKIINANSSSNLPWRSSTRIGSKVGLQNISSTMIPTIAPLQSINYYSPTEDMNFHYNENWRDHDYIVTGTGGAMVTPHGTITIRMHDRIRVDLTLDRAIRVVNIKNNIVMSVSATGSASGLLHPNGRVYQYGSRVEIMAHDKHSHNNKYAKMWYKGVSFTSDQCALVYLVDSAGTRTTTDTFSDLNQDFSLSIFYNESRHGSQFFQEALNVLQSTQHWFAEDRTENWIINNIRISQTVDGLVRVGRNSNKFSLRTSPANGSASVSTPYVHCTGSMGQTSHLFVRRGERRMHYDGASFIVRNAGHSAGFDDKHQLKVF